jgi:predicted transcriptional regulator
MSIEESILISIKALPAGDLFLPADFSDLGSSEAVRISLFRLEKEGVIYRVAQGIYVLPKESSFLGKLIPSAEEVAEAIAKRDRIPWG